MLSFLNLKKCSSIFSCVCVHVDVQSLSHVRLFVTLWTAARQAPLFMEFSKQRMVAISYSRDLPDPGTKPMSLAFPTVAGRFFTTAPPGKLHIFFEVVLFFHFLA